jgi:hypothetical protein
MPVIRDPYETYRFIRVMRLVRDPNATQLDDPHVMQLTQAPNVTIIRWPSRDTTRTRSKRDLLDAALDAFRTRF